MGAEKPRPVLGETGGTPEKNCDRSQKVLRPVTVLTPWRGACEPPVAWALPSLQQNIQHDRNAKQGGDGGEWQGAPLTRQVGEYLCEQGGVGA